MAAPQPLRGGRPHRSPSLPQLSLTARSHRRLLLPPPPPQPSRPALGRPRRRLTNHRPSTADLSTSAVCHHLAASLSWSYAASAFPHRPRTSPSATPPPQSLRPALGIASPDHWPLTADCQPSLPRHLSLPIRLPQPPLPLVCVTPVSVPAPACCRLCGRRLPCRTATLPPATVSTRDNFIFNFFFFNLAQAKCNHGLATASAVVNINHDIRWLSCLAPQQLPPLALVVFPVASFIVTAISRSNCPFSTGLHMSWKDF